MNDSKALDKLFGTDGIRGKVGVYPLTEDMIYSIGLAAGVFVKNTNPHKRAKQRILLAKDTRASADMFESVLIKAITASGVDIIRLGIVTTPCAAYLTKKLGHDMAIVISASHNGIDDNGIKFFSHRGCKLSLNEERELEGIIISASQSLPDDIKQAVSDSGASEETTPVTQHGCVKDYTQAVSSYGDLLKSVIGGSDISGYKIAADCAFGAISHILPELARHIGLNMQCINNTPDGANINSSCGSLHPEVISEYVTNNGFDLGLAFDGDGDRVILCDEKGRIFDGDFILAIISKYLFEKGSLNKNSFVTTLMSNIGLEIAVGQWGGKIIKTDVGDKYVLDRMFKSKLNLGGEQSGHIVLSDYSPTGDGLLAGLFVLKIISESGKPLSAFFNCMYKFPQILLNVDVSCKVPIEELPKTRKIIEKTEKKFGSKGRLYVRYSGTENKLRIMVEGQSSVEIKEIAEDIANSAKEELLCRN